jgi:hypothetical protein
LKVRWNKYRCFGCNLEGKAVKLPFLLLGDEGLDFFERELKFSRHNVIEMAVFKWHARREALEQGDCVPDILEDYEPSDDFDKLRFGVFNYSLDTMYRAALKGVRDLDEYWDRLDREFQN